MKKIKDLKKEIFLALLLNLTILTALIFRCMHIDFPSGLWLDELCSAHIANKSSVIEMLQWLVKYDVHPPLYFITLHFWINLLGDNDSSLRLLSVVFGLLNIPVIYLAGKELESKQTGLLAAFFVAINSFLIYYSQEVRFYALTALLVSLSILFLIKTFKKFNNRNLILLMITNILIIFTYTIGAVFVGFEILIFTSFLFIKDKKKSLKFLLIQTFLPFGLFLAYFPVLSAQLQNKIHQITFSTNFNFSNLYLYMQNWFSPFIRGRYFNFENYFNYINLKDINFYIFTTIPIIIGIVGLIKALFKKNIAQIIFLTIFLFISSLILVSLTDKLCILSRYTIIILPSLLLIMAYGLISLKSNFIKYSLICSYIFINLFYILYGQDSVLKIIRIRGYNIPVVTLQNNFNLNSNDIILFTGGDFLRRYLPSNYGELLFFSGYGTPPLTEEKLEKLENNNYKFFKDYFISQKLFPSTNLYFNKNILNELEKERYFIVIRNTGLFGINKERIKKITENENEYLKKPLKILVINKFINDIEELANQNLKCIYIEEIGPWSIKTYQNI